MAQLTHIARVHRESSEEFSLQAKRQHLHSWHDEVRVPAKYFPGKKEVLAVRIRSKIQRARERILETLPRIAQAACRTKENLPEKEGLILEALCSHVAKMRIAIE